MKCLIRIVRIGSRRRNAPSERESGADKQARKMSSTRKKRVMMKKKSRQKNMRE